jgi:hypothetical protein
MDRIVRGTPIWLLRFPFVEKVLYLFDRTAVISSFVVVFPFVPVIPITFA